MEETLAGRAAQIKERNIGVDVFGKHVAFDPQEESLVRVSAGEVRRRLSRAYAAEPAGAVRIQLPVGSYCPVFHLTVAVAPPGNPVPPALLASPAASPLPVAAAQPVFSRRRAWLAAAALLCFAGMALYALSGRSEAAAQRRQLDRLWAPFSNQKQPVLIALPSPTVYSLLPSGAAAPPGMIPAVNLKASDGDFIGLGAGVGAARFAEQLAQRHQPFIVKSGKDVSFADLSQSPAILLGGYTSNLGVELTRRLRFSLRLDATTDRIVDNEAGGHGSWVIARIGPQAEAHEGYALITILRDSETGHPVMIVAGLRISDTQAAVDFLTNADYFRAYTQKAPSDWARKNSQIVLHSFDHGGAPGRAEVVALHFW